MAIPEDEPYDDMDWGPRTLGPRSYGSIRERRSTIWNDDENLPVLDRARTETTDTYKGKFFPRGCRGMIEQVQIYSAGDAADIITLQMSPHPCIGPLYTLNVIPGIAEGWYAADFEQMWDYDSLFIWVSALEANVSWWYDEFLPYDGHQHTPRAGPPDPLYSPWVDLDIRPFIRVVYSGETPGDVPVSGIINNIKIPNSSSHFEEEDMELPQTVLTLVESVPGAGFVDLFIASVNAEANSHATGFQVRCDGNIAWSWALGTMNIWGFDPYTQPMSLPVYAVDGFCVMMITKKFEFRRLFELYAWNNFAAVTIHTRVYPNMLR